MKEGFFEIHNQAKDAAFQCLPSQDTENKNNLEQPINKLKNPFTSLNSEAKRNKYFTVKWGNVEPVEKVLGTRFDSRRNKTAGTNDQVILTDKFTYVPILETLRTIFQSPELAIHLCALFHNQDMRRYSFNSILILVNDLKVLETEGPCLNL